MTKSSSPISRQINSSTKVIITPLNHEITTTSSVYAINWFNLKFKWLYNFYNILAAPLLLKVGGKVHFKGFQKKKVYGNNKDGRDALLIVNYASVASFLNMISKTYFQLISILRITATSRFNFGFTQRDDQKGKIGGEFKGRYYLVHHYSSTSPADTTAKITSLGNKFGARTYFSGEKSATISREDSQGKQQEAPFIIDVIIVLESKEEDSLKKLTTDKDYLQIIEEANQCYVAFFGRVA